MFFTYPEKNDTAQKLNLILHGRGEYIIGRMGISCNYDTLIDMVVSYCKNPPIFRMKSEDFSVCGKLF